MIVPIAMQMREVRADRVVKAVSEKKSEKMKYAVKNAPDMRSASADLIFVKGIQMRQRLISPITPAAKTQIAETSSLVSCDFVPMKTAQSTAAATARPAGIAFFKIPAKNPGVSLL